MELGARITGGVVSVMERRKLGDYEHREVKCEFSFSSGDGLDHRDIADQAAHEAAETVKRLLSSSSPGNGAPATRGPGKVPGKVPGKKDAAVKDARALSAPEQKELEASEVDAGMVEVVTEAEGPAVTDAELVSALAKKNQVFVEQEATGGAAAIKRLIWTYVPQGQSVKTLPADKRREFLARLEELAV